MESKGKKRKTSKPKLKKPKVYISSYKVILVCAAVIVFCMGLLFVTNSISKTTDSKNNVPEIAERFEEPKVPKSAESVVESPYYKEQKKSSSKDNSKSEKTVKQEKSVNANDSRNAVPVKKAEEKTERKGVPAESLKIQKNESEKKAVPLAEDKKIEKKEETKKSFGFPAAKNRAQLIFVFDDGGQNLNQLEKFMSLPFPFTVAVLPALNHSAETARRVRNSGNEVILHQPMQPLGGKNPGPGAIMLSMTEAEVRHTLLQNINEIAPIEGVNNHEGSAVTADIEKMAVVLQTVADCGIYFLDSRTNVETVVPFLAKEMGYHYYERNIFLDNEKTKENILAELKKGLTIANKNGVVIMIGHVWSADILPEVLKEVYPELKEKGYTFSVVSKSNARK